MRTIVFFGGGGIFRPTVKYRKHPAWAKVIKVAAAMRPFAVSTAAACFIPRLSNFMDKESMSPGTRGEGGTEPRKHPATDIIPLTHTNSQ